MRNSTFRIRLRELLDTRGISAAQLSRDVGVSEASISHYLKGHYEAKQDVVYKISQRYLLNEAWLMGYDDVPMYKYQNKEEDTTANSTLSPERAEMKNKIDKMSDEDFDRFTQALRLIFPDKF